MFHSPMLVIERATADEATFGAIYKLLLELHHTVGVFPLNPQKMAEQAYGVVAAGMTFIARDIGQFAADNPPDPNLAASAPIVGSIGLVESLPWYADEPYLQDKWFFVSPSYRGPAGLKLLRAARDECIARDRIGYVWNTNPDKRQKALPFGVEAQRLGYVPFGYMLRLNSQRR
jgi:hypothetical protein